MTHPDQMGNNQYEEQGNIALLRTALVERYGGEAEFLYTTPSGERAMLGIDAIMTICGGYIADMSFDTVQPLFDRYHEHAQKIHEAGDNFVELTRRIGQKALAKFE